jgi:pimeloyl-ACP methyl ester carboxylesterase
MTGEEDAYLPYDALLRLSLSVQGLRVIRIPESGHAVPAEHPKHVADAITYFVQTVHGE